MTNKRNHEAHRAARASRPLGAALFWLVLLSCLPPLGTARAAQAGLSKAVREARRMEKAVVETLRRVEPAYVFIGGGSGVLISPDGLMLTNHHVAHSSKRWQVRVGGRRYLAMTQGSDPRGDLCLLKLQGADGLPYVEFADSDQLRVGQQVIAVGNPFATAGFVGEPTATLGIISVLHRFQGSYSDAIQTDAPINPGNSGGPLLTLDGKLAGINGRIETRFGARANTGIGMAIPARQIQRFIPLLKKAAGGRVYHGTLRGLVGDARETDGLQNGAEIKEVRAGSPAGKLGFQAGDRIIQLDRYKVRNFARFRGVLGTYPAGSTLKVQYVRGGKTLHARITLEPLNPGSMGFALRRPRRPGEPLAIERVHPHLAADKAGLKPGDVLLALNGEPIGNFRDYFLVFRKWQLAEPLAGETVKLKVRRGKGEKSAELEFTLTLTSAYDNPPARRRPRRR